MRKAEQLLTAVPAAAVRNLPELYAIAVEMAETATRRYGALAARTDDDFWPVRCVFEVLTTRERERAASLIAACTEACGRSPNASDHHWTPVEMVPADEMADVGNSDLSTPYTAWKLAVRHRQRAFVFWTYVVALAVDPKVRATAEGLAQEALWDSNLLRRERRLSWRKERAAKQPGGHETEEPVSAALLESLLLKDIIAWSQNLPSAQGAHLLALDPFHPPTDALAEVGNEAFDLGGAGIETIRRRVLQRAEKLSTIYLDDADHAADQDSMELAQKLAARSIMRLAGLRVMASLARDTS